MVNPCQHAGKVLLVCASLFLGSVQRFVYAQVEQVRPNQNAAIEPQQARGPQADNDDRPRSLKLAPARVSASLLAVPDQRLMMEQVGELAQSGQIVESLALLQRLLDDAESRLVPASGAQRASTIETLKFVPLSVWAAATTTKLLEEFPDQVDRYETELGDRAQIAFEELKLRKDPLATKLAARRYFATRTGSQLNLLLSDLMLEQGWGVASYQAAEQASSLLRYDLAAKAFSCKLPCGTDSSIGASLVWGRLRHPGQQQNLVQSWKQALDNDASAREEANCFEALRRLVMAASINPRELDAQHTRDFAEAVANAFTADNKSALVELVKASEKWSCPENEAQPPTIALEKFPPVLWPYWNHSLEKYSASADRIAVSKPRVAETENGTLPYFPQVDQGRVYVNELTRVVAYDLATGQAWPDARGALPLYDSGIAPEAFLPRYPLIGTPRGMLHIADQCLYARMGSPITGRLATRRDAESQGGGYLIGLDLSKQGKMLAGFPLRLDPVKFPNAEFEGPPIVWGQMLVVAISQRDNVGLRRSVAAFDRFAGDLIWHSDVLAEGSIPAAERTNVIANQMLTIVGGRLLVNTNLGAIACLDPLDGSAEWLVLYASPAQEANFAKPDRYRYRSMNPCLVSEGLVYCAPQDTPEIFALDVTTGDLVWSTDDWQVADVAHVLGVKGRSLVVSGDRLIWLDKRSGQVLGRFPASTTPQLANALPNPRGLGRGELLGDWAYWPTAGEILVFPSELPEYVGVDDVPIVRRIRLGTRGTEGVNLLFSNGWMVATSPSRVMAFHIQSGQNSVSE